MRNRAWRRHMEQVWVIRRLKRRTGGYFFQDVNRNRYKKVLVIDFLEKSEYFFLKSNTTDLWVSRNKDKYSPNRSKNGWYRSGDGNKTREWNSRYLLKILKENGLK
jgi:hypothetical protein